MKKHRIKNLLWGIFFAAAAGYVAANHSNWVIVVFEFIEIPYTGPIIAGGAALCCILFFIRFFEGTTDKEEEEENEGT